jgi:D-alanyl-lipoteichoic acid acyltransferase DltB (MBOAT superfamily)
MALGIGKLLGFRFLKNFSFPYFSRDIAEFWRRWHISLNTWFRDYIYIPLGGSRVSKAKVVRNTFVIFLVSGFWHGANWTFIAWGAYHAILFLPFILLGKNRKNTDTVAERNFLPNFKELFQMLLTFLLVVFGWILFRANSIWEAFSYFGGMIQWGTLRAFYRIFMFPEIWGIIALVIIEWLGRNNQYAIEKFNFTKKWYIRWIFYYAITMMIICFGGEEQKFIYFQF